MTLLPRDEELNPEEIKKAAFVEAIQTTKAAVNYFSFVTPLKGLSSDLTSMNRPVFVSRLTQWPEGV